MRIFLLLLLLTNVGFSQTTITIQPSQLLDSCGQSMMPGVFFVPKTSLAYQDFVDDFQPCNAIRSNVIESVLNNNISANDAVTQLLSYSTQLQEIAAKTDELYFIFEKMPPWLSSSSDSSPATTPGWAVLHTKAPASWNAWEQMVDTITETLITIVGTEKLRMEIWNEPDLGSWTDTKAAYFDLYKRTFTTIKQVNSLIRVGGPASNYWANNIGFQAPYGGLSYSEASQSLISELMDSCFVWNLPPDFLSFHYFGITHQVFESANSFIQTKWNTLFPTDSLEIVVSEWNAPSAVRETSLATSWMGKALLSIQQQGFGTNMIAAWQDFEPGGTEFHQDYGLLSYGSIRKPAYYSSVLAAMLSGNFIPAITSHPADCRASVKDDTLSFLLVNYCPPPIVEAMNHTLFDNEYLASDLDTAGYISLAGNDLSVLESIYNGTTIIPSDSGLNDAVNSAIPFYNHFDSIATQPRFFQLQLDGFSGNYLCSVYRVNDQTNNPKFRYDSLLLEGYTAAQAVDSVLLNQSLTATTEAFMNGSIMLSLEPNELMVIQVVLPELTLSEMIPSGWMLYPNPGSSWITIFATNELPVEWTVRASDGKNLGTICESGTMMYDVSSLPDGVYYFQNSQNCILRFVKLGD